MKNLSPFLFLLFLISCKEQVDNGTKYNKEFIIGAIPDTKSFLTLNDREKSIDSIFTGNEKGIDSLVQIDTVQTLLEKVFFVKNRSRILLTEVENGVESIRDREESGQDGFSAFCDCGVFQDTLFVNSTIGFFGGVGVSLKVYGNQFKSEFYQYTDDVKPYKLTTKSEYTEEINVESKYQYLRLEKKPTYKAGQQLTGFLTLTSKEFFENRVGEKLDTNFVKAEVKFTCLTKGIKERLWSGN